MGLAPSKTEKKIVLFIVFKNHYFIILKLFALFLPSSILPDVVGPGIFSAKK